MVNPPIVIPEHSLFTGDGGSGPDPMEELRAPGAGQSHHSQKHHGASGQACGIRPQCDCLLPGLYRQCGVQRSIPTWPEQALRANIHCQISLALNRIYTEWYPSKGYTFNITNSTSYDQYYVHGRTVFDVMVRITDDIFNTYIRKTGTVKPLLL